MAKLVDKLVKILNAHNCFFVRYAKGSHTIWHSPITNKDFVVPSRLNNRNTANGILKDAGIDGKFKSEILDVFDDVFGIDLWAPLKTHEMQSGRAFRRMLQPKILPTTPSIIVRQPQAVVWCAFFDFNLRQNPMQSCVPLVFRGALI